jgi:hypothetical protein
MHSEAHTFTLASPPISFHITLPRPGQSLVLFWEFFMRYIVRGDIENESYNHVQAGRGVIDKNRKHGICAFYQTTPITLPDLINCETRPINY